VKKILLLKSRLGLHKQPFVDTDRLMHVLHSPQSLAAAQKIARQAVTLIKNKNLPIAFNKNHTFYVLAHSADPGFRFTESDFLSTLSDFYPYPLYEQINPFHEIVNQQNILADAASADYLINVFYLNEPIDFPGGYLQLITSLDELNKPMINVFLGSPYISGKLPSLPNNIFAYSAEPYAQQAAAEALVGKNEITGKLPVDIPDVALSGDGLQLPSAPMMLQNVDDRAGCPNPGYIDSLKIFLNEAIADSAFPGCAIAVGHNGQLLLQEGFGHYVYDPRSKQVNAQSIYDLASVTKVVATTTMSMILVDRGRLQLEWKVQDVIPDFQGPDKEIVTIRHLLTHTSGLPGWKRFYLELSGKERIVQEICDTDLIYQPGSQTVYSDLGMILMQRILETITQKSLDRLVKENITDPLGMTRTFYNPDRALLNEIVPTEFSEFHNLLVRGFVHDENTYAMGGVSGHAGLFSTAEDLAVFCQMYLNGGIYDYQRILRPETIEQFTKRQDLVENSTRALGWDTRSETGSMSGDYMSMRAFGHSGFTGTTIWMDPENQVFVVLLTNRVHPTRENQKIRQVRPVVHDYVMRAVLDN
jgi:CubicO group peptidase (beta-lactamase class C family)